MTRRVDGIMNPGYSASRELRHLYACTQVQRDVALQRLAIMHVGLIAANTSTVQSVHVRTRASYALLSFLMVLGACTSTPGAQPITACTAMQP